MDDYLEICRGLTPPTDAQCEAFAKHMGSKHSWYKHLPLEPWTPFHFVVGPRAELHSDWGNRLPDRRYVGVTTPDGHRAAYGCLDCVSPPWGFVGYGEDVVRDVQRLDKELWVLGPDDRTLSVPPEVMKAGTACANSFVDPRARRVSPRYWTDSGYGARAYLRRLGHDVDDDATYDEVYRRVITTEHIAAVRDQTLAEMIAAIHRVRALVWG